MAYSISPQQIAAIPEELRERRQWVVWKYEHREGKETKVPYNAVTGERASSTNPRTWTDFDKAVSAASSYDGIGFVWSADDPYVAVDLDSCRNAATGEVTEWGRRWIDQFYSYTELSPTGTGLHVIVRGTWGEDRWNKKTLIDAESWGPKAAVIEVYSSARYFTFTGEMFPGMPLVIAPAQGPLDTLLAAYGEVAPARPAERHRPTPLAMDDEELLERARNAVNGERFRALYDQGDLTPYGGDDSAAELALCNHLAFWTGNDAPRMDRLVRSSALMRDKWERPDYRDRTIAEAIRVTPEPYRGGKALGRNGATTETTETTKAPARTTSHPFVVSVVHQKFTQDLEPEALYGLAGDVVRLISPHTESHPAAILASFLTQIGCMIGRQPHVSRDGARHAANEFACLVGSTAKGRKGTASRRVEEVVDQIDIAMILTTTTFTTCNMRLGGLGSGEALIKAVEDPKDDDESFLVHDRNDKSPPRKRKLVYEEEFSRSLKVMRRDGSVLSEVLRQAWDGGTLSVRTKAKAMISTHPHICILAHITQDELKEQMAAVDMFNGFANRFLWFSVKRSQSLPFGGGDIDSRHLAQDLSQAISLSQMVNRLEFDTTASKVWAEGGVYDLLTERPEGLLGAVTSRAEAHVTRLALLYALLDAASSIRVEHLLGALAVWDYNEKSCQDIFGGSLGDHYADLILEVLMEAYPGYLSRTDIRDKFNRNAPPGRLPKALTLLQDQKVIDCTRQPGDGRPPEYFAATELAFKGPKRGGETPLERARRFLKEMPQ